MNIIYNSLRIYIYNNKRDKLCNAYEKDFLSRLP